MGKRVVLFLFFLNMGVELSGSLVSCCGPGYSLPQKKNYSYYDLRFLTHFTERSC